MSSYSACRNIVRLPIYLSLKIARGEIFEKLRSKIEVVEACGEACHDGRRPLCRRAKLSAGGFFEI